MADPNEEVPPHDLSHEPARSKFNAEGWDQEGDNQGAAMVLNKRESTSARVETLMASGMQEEDAKKQAVSELEQRLEGKTADVETYVRLFSKVALTADELKIMALNDPRQVPFNSPLPFTARAILYPGNKPLLRYGARDGSIKEVRIDPLAIATVKQAIIKHQDEAAAGKKASLLTSNIGNVAYDHIKGRLQDLGFHFEQSRPEDELTPYDQKVALTITQKSRTERLKATEAKRVSFDF